MRTIATTVLLAIACTAQAKTTDGPPNKTFALQPICQRGQGSRFWFLGKFHIRAEFAPDRAELNKRLGISSEWDQIFGADCFDNGPAKDGTCTIIDLSIPNPNKPISAWNMQVNNSARVVSADENTAAVEWGNYIFKVDFKQGKISSTFTRDDTRQLGEARCTIGAR